MDTSNASLKVRSFPKGRGKAWFWIQKRCFDTFRPILGNDGLVLYCVLCRYEFNQRVENRTVEYLGNEAGFRRTKAFALLDKLEECGLIRRIRVPGRLTAYLLLDIDHAIQQFKVTSRSLLAGHPESTND
jgi:hypothetical protein